VDSLPEAARFELLPQVAESATCELNGPETRTESREDSSPRGSVPARTRRTLDPRQISGRAIFFFKPYSQPIPRSVFLAVRSGDRARRGTPQSGIYGAGIRGDAIFGTDRHLALTVLLQAESRQRCSTIRPNGETSVLERSRFSTQRQTSDAYSSRPGIKARPQPSK